VQLGLVSPEHLSGYERNYVFFKLDNVMACTVNNSVHFLQCFWSQNNQLGMWPHSLDLNPHNFCMGHVKLCSNNNYTEDNLHMRSA
jgi:hypothetical protein